MVAGIAGSNYAVSELVIYKNPAGTIATLIGNLFAFGNPLTQADFPVFYSQLASGTTTEIDLIGGLTANAASPSIQVPGPNPAPAFKTSNLKRRKRNGNYYL